MELQPGTILGSYEIVGPLGAGAMGAVYRARDPRLARSVAIKVVSERALLAPHALERFEQEARAASAIAHPNIVTVHEIGHVDATPFIVMELVEGKSLRELLSGARLPLKTLLSIAVQIADGLAAAHARSIVHRDVKPENVMVTSGGVVKILDFGIARATKTSGAPGDSTTTSPLRMMTEPGTIVGTASYMSPEQARGSDVDFRTDQFSFGSVLYEMATGRTAFKRDTIPETIVAIVREEPLPVRDLSPTSPAPLRWIIERCLAKEREGRYDSTQDLARELHSLKDHASEIGGATPVAAESPVFRKRGPGASWIASLIALGLLSAACLPLAIAHLRHGPTAGSALRLGVLAPEATTFTGGFAVSPDGRSLVFSAADAEGQRALWVRSLETGAEVRLDGTEGGLSSFWSPDGRQIAFFTREKLKKIEAAGGSVRTLCDTTGIAGYGDGTWSTAGVILFGSGQPSQPLYRVSADGGVPAAVTEFSGPAGSWPSHTRPQFLPDGRHFVYRLQSSERKDLSGVYFGSLDGGKPVEVVRGYGFCVGYAAGYLLYTKDDSLYAQPFDVRSGRTSGDPVRLSERIASFSVSQNILVFSPMGASSIELTWFDRAGKELGRIGERRGYRYPSLSPDGKRVAASLFEEKTGLGDLWIIDVDRDVASRYSYRPAWFNQLIWSPDGSEVVYTAKDKDGFYQLVKRESDGTGPEEPLLTTGWSKFPTDWSADGRFVAYEELDPKSNKTRLWLLPMSGDRKHVTYLQGSSSETQAKFSPDGRWMAYGSDESGQTEIYVQAIPASRGKWQISSAGGIQPRWRKDGRELFYLSLDSKIVSVEAKLSPVPSFGAPKPLFVARIARTSPAEFLPTADGQRFLTANITSPSRSPRGVTVLVNWTAALKK